MTSLNGNPESVEKKEHPKLTPCPCGAEAVWYRVVLWPDLSAGLGQPVGALVANDFYDDLCDRCFAALVEAAAQTGTEMERGGWVQIGDSKPINAHAVDTNWGGANRKNVCVI